MSKRLFFLISLVLLFVVGSLSGSARAGTVEGTVRSATINTDWAVPQNVTALSEGGDWRLWDAVGAPEYEKNTSYELIGDLEQVLSFTFYNVDNNQNFTWSDGVDPVSTDLTGVGVGSQNVAGGFPIEGGYQVDVTLPSGSANITVWGGTRAGIGSLVILDGTVEVFSMDGGNRGTVWGLDRFDLEAAGFSSNTVLTIQWILSPSSTDTSARMQFYGVAVAPGEPMNKASNPNPDNKETDVTQDVICSWTPGMYIEENGGTHNVFFGENFDDVNEATVSDPLGTITSIDQIADDNDFVPSTLEFGKTYYWRVDEVNDSSSPGTNTGTVWSFTVEAVALNLPYQNILKVSAISSYTNNDPNDTVNENGLDPNNPDQHSKSSGSWASSGNDANNVWIQYDFDKQYKIHEMLVWNYNHSINKIKGFREVLIEYSEDGSDTWTELTDVNEFNKATGKDDYEYNTVVPFDDVVIKSVRITALTGWGSKNSLGLSEIRFTYIPVRARKPSPDDETTDVDVERTLTWRKGREAVTHKVYIGTDEDAVTNGTSSSYTTSVSNYSPALTLGRTYYWRVDEINNSMTPSVWESEVWSFSTKSSILIEGFEKGYGNTAADAVYKTWKDGVELQDSTNGSYMGRPSPPYLDTINHSGGHSAPMTYDTLTHTYSEVIAQSVKLPIGTSNWSIGSPATLTIWFRGDPNTTEVGDSELYCKIGGKTAVYGGSMDALARDRWYQWDIDLTTLGANLSNIPQITIGVRKVGSKGGTGVIWLDDIMLSGLAPAIPTEGYWIEAESGSVTAPMMKFDDVTASGGQYVSTEEDTADAGSASPYPDGTLTVPFTVEGGVYSIQFRVSTPGNDTSCWVQVPDANEGTDWAQYRNMPNSVNWHWAQEYGSFTLTAGTHDLLIAYRGSELRFDAIWIAKID